MTTHIKTIHGLKIAIKLYQFEGSEVSYNMAACKAASFCNAMPEAEFLAALDSDGNKAGSDALIKIDNSLPGNAYIDLQRA